MHPDLQRLIEKSDSPIFEFRKRVSELGITSDAEGVAEKIRELSRSQQELWQRVPRLALEASGRERISPLSSQVDPYGCLLLESYEKMSPEDSSNYVYVDLATGELVVPEIERSGFHGNYKTAPSEDVIRLAFNLSDLNAERLVDILKREGKHPYHPLAGVEERCEEDKESERERTPEVFIRE